MPAGTKRFGALRNRNSRPYLFASGLAMMGDNVEHVTTYWVLWERFHSPALVGFAVISHWLPYLALSVYLGGLADMYDCRRLIQIGQSLFIFASLAWGVLLLTGTLLVWQACVLLVLHGLAGAICSPAEQLMLRDFVKESELPGAVRLNATFRSLGVLAGPVVGSALMLAFGATAAIFVNALFYLPMTILMTRTPFTGHSRAVSSGAGTVRVTLSSTLGVLRTVGKDRSLISAFALAGLTALTVGGAIQVSMPVFAKELGADGAGVAYGALLLANGAGGVVGGFILEASGIIRASIRTAALSTALFGAMILTFVLVDMYAAAVVALAIGGMANIASMSVTQSIVQLQAPPGEHGRLFGVYSMVANGFRTANGITLGVLGALLGIPNSLALCAAILIVGALLAGLYGRGTMRTQH
ncbi:MFS transporter [Pseudarthrobacter sp. YAF2]|uniref:MFS transporter n=1 Tax=Pseudarthrobacter sp. YAF2 TaxID=3233078 RepID=UPI003F9D6009